MNRLLPLLTAPEPVLALLTAVLFVFCARHNSFSDDDVRSLERLIWLLPLLVMLSGFGTIAFATAKTWTWLVRANLATMICLAVCAARIVNGFGAPGSGPKGQDAGFILALSLGVVCSAFANAICGAIILRAQRPAFAAWFHQHAIVGSLLTALASAPLAIVPIALAGTLVVLGSIALSFTKS